MSGYLDNQYQVPNYSGVNIQIINPAVNMGASGNNPTIQGCTGYNQVTPEADMSSTPVATVAPQANNNPNTVGWSSIPQGSIYNNNTNEIHNNIQYPEVQQQVPQTQPQYQGYPYPMPYQAYPSYPPYQPYQPYPPYPPYPQQVSEQKTEPAETKEEPQMGKKHIVALTDNYIKSLENYLNNPNREIRLQAAKEIVKRFEEEPTRYNDAALNALTNKMLQDPQGSIRGIALSLLSTGTAQGNDYTFTLLNNIKNDTTNKEDALQASEALLRMSGKTETISYPLPKNTEIPNQVEKE